MTSEIIASVLAGIVGILDLSRELLNGLAGSLLGLFRDIRICPKGISTGRTLSMDLNNRTFQSGFETTNDVPFILHSGLKVLKDYN